MPLHAISREPEKVSAFLVIQCRNSLPITLNLFKKAAVSKSVMTFVSLVSSKLSSKHLRGRMNLKKKQQRKKEKKSRQGWVTFSDIVPQWQSAKMKVLVQQYWSDRRNNSDEGTCLSRSGNGQGCFDLRGGWRPQATWIFTNFTCFTCENAEICAMSCSNSRNEWLLLTGLSSAKASNEGQGDSCWKVG